MNSPKQKNSAIRVNISWGSLKDIPTIYSNQLMINFTGGEFYLVFGEVPPLGLVDKNNPPKSIEIKPVAKIAITSENMLKFEEVIHKNVDKNKKTLKSKEK